MLQLCYNYVALLLLISAHKQALYWYSVVAQMKNPDSRLHTVRVCAVVCLVPLHDSLSCTALFNNNQFIALRQVLCDYLAYFIRLIEHFICFKEHCNLLCDVINRVKKRHIIIIIFHRGQ